MTDLPSLVNGESLDTVQVSDRGFMYGDGLFETMRVSNGGIDCWPLHMQRLAEGCRRLSLAMPDETQLGDEADKLVSDQGDCVLKLVLTRGSGGRGYRAAASPLVTRVMSCHPLPRYPAAYQTSGVHIRLCRTRLSKNPLLAGIKHLNRLEQVLARLEWEDDAIAEGLMLDPEDSIIEGVMSNLFLVRNGRLLTPDLGQCGVAGIARSICLAVANKCKIPTMIRAIKKDELLQADEIFLTNSINGVWPVRRIEDDCFSPGEITRQLMDEFDNQPGAGVAWQAN